ncbi:MAG: HAD-IA family hydrolase [Pseudomonadota bacterium]
MLQVNRLQAVFFDLDGTLIDTAPDMGGALNFLLRERGRTELPQSQIRPHVSHGANALIKLGFGELGESEHENLRREFLEYYSDHLAVESNVFDGFDEVLSHIESRKLLWGVITNKPGWLTDPLLQQLGLYDRCASVVSADTCAKRKPHPMPMYHACEVANVEAKNCVYIGDAERDMQAGKAAGMQTVGALYGYIAESDDPPSWNADAFVNTPLELLPLLRG